jgi:hypothetical protein
MSAELNGQLREAGYESPAIERELDAESMERERHYAGDGLSPGVDA